MADPLTLLLLEDEPLILMDLEMAAEDRGCDVLSADSAKAALDHIEARASSIDVAILDVSLGHDTNCFPVAHELDRQRIPYILHSGDLDRHNERIRKLNAMLIAKPAPVEMVIERAMAHATKPTD